jgi:hypothetical protein
MNGITLSIRQCRIKRGHLTAHEILSTILVLLATTIGLQAMTYQEFVPRPEGGNVQIEVSAPEPSTTRMVYAYPEIVNRTIVADGELYTHIGIPGESHTTQVGRPELPMVNRVIGIPDQGEMRVRVVSAEYTETHGVRIFPMQPWAQESQNNAEVPFTRDAEFYRTTGWYPPHITEISEPAIMRDVRMAVVTTFPVQYNPNTGTVRTYSHIEVVVEPTGQPGTNEKTHHFDHPSPSFMPLYRQLANFDQLGLDEAPILPGTALIVCQNDAIVLNQVNELADWKRHRGTITRVATTSETGTSFYSIKAWIQSFYNSADPPLEFVILIGDATTNATDPYSIPANGSGYSGTDHDYTTLEGGDDIADVAVGRLSVNNSGELDIVVNKSIRYERNTYMGQTHWYTRAYLLAGTAHTCASNITTKEWVRSRMYEHGFDDVRLDTHYGHINATLMRQQVSIGCTFFNWRGSWIGEMSVGDLSGLNNGWMLPQTVTITCSTGDFVGYGADLTEAWLRYGSVSNGNGAIGCIGTSTSGTHVNFNNFLDASLYYGYFVMGYPEAGMALKEAKFQMYRNYWPWESGYVSNYNDWTNLMGDPELKTWTAVPIELRAEHENSLAVGCNQIEVTIVDENDIPVEGAIVTAMNNDTYSRMFTDELGQVILPIELESAGTLDITAWKHNYLPYEGEVTVTQMPLWVSFEEMEIDDDNSGGTSGNDNGVFNPGEVVDLTVTMHNYGNSQTATSVTGVLSSLDLHTATVINSTQTFPNIPPNQSAVSNGAFRVQVGSTTQDQDLARMFLEMTVSGNDQTSLIEETIESGDLEYVNHQFTGTGNRLDPGETETMVVTVNNLGHLDIGDAEGRLFSESSFVSFPDPLATFGDISQGSNGNNNSNPFQISANPMTFPGTRVRLGIAWEGDASFTDTLYYDIAVGSASANDPTGPDEYGYYCFDDTDTDYEMCPEYEWIEIDPNQQGPGDVLPIDDNYEDDDESVSVSLPFRFQMYGIAEDTITVCSNGWAALGDQTQFVNFRNWHLPGPQGPDLMIAPFWDELVNSGGRVCHYHDPVNGWYIVEWSRMHLRNGNQTETFELILYDPAVWPTLTGDGMIKFQYHTVYQGTAAWNDNDYATIGIENDDQEVGLELSYWNTYSPGIATVAAGRAYFITNMVSFQTGCLEGTVTDAATGLPVVGAMVSAENGSYWDTTDTFGDYFIPDVLVSEYTLFCDKLGYNTGVDTVTITEDDTITQNFDLLHPEFELDVTEIIETMDMGDTLHRNFHLSNQGNGPLEYSISMDFHLNDMGASPEATNPLPGRRGPVASGGTDDPDEPWDELLRFDVTFITGDQLIQGAAFAWGSFWVVGGGLLSGEPNQIYKFDPMGNYQGSTQQPSTTVYGFRDLAYDGEYLWGSESEWLVAFDTSGVIHDSIPGPLNPNRCLTYDPGEDVFYCGDITATIYAIDRDGNIVNSYSGHGMQVYGLAWFRDDPDGYPLYLFCEHGGLVEIEVQKMDPSTGDIQYVTNLDGEPGDRAGGIMVSPSWNPLFYTLVGQIMGSFTDKVGVWEIAPNTAWITYSPTSGTVQGSGQQTFEVLLDTREILTGEYGVNLVFAHNAISQSDTLRVRLTVTSAAVEPEEEVIPFTYSLDQNYPNPFNPTTVIPYSIRDRVRVNLNVYNILGQRVARLIDDVQDPGQYKATFNVSNLASGIYFYRLEAGPFTRTHKMVILK